MKIGENLDEIGGEFINFVGIGGICIIDLIGGMDASDRTVQYFGSVWYKNDGNTGQCIVNTCSSILCATDTGTASVRYFGESHLATLSVHLFVIACC